MEPEKPGSGVRVAQLVPLLKLRHLGDRRFDYLAPVDLASRLQVGSLVSVPFGHRIARGVVVALADKDRPGLTDLRSILSVEEDPVRRELLILAEQLADRYLASYEACLRLVVPPRVSTTGRTAGGLARAWIARVESASSGSAIRLTAKQERVLASIPPGGCAAQVACAAAGTSLAVLKALIAKGLVEVRPLPKAERPPDEAGAEPSEDLPALSVEQSGVVKELTRVLASGELVRRQLWGVTGSGKTEVYLRLIAQVLNAGGAAILLVPEIALTTQTVERVRARFGERVGVLHSGLPPAERRRQYGRIAQGEARVVVGARSAVFAPVSNLRLIIIDESHDASYKQEEEPRYHARVAAELRLRDSGGLLLEGSATPAVEAMVEARDCLRLTRRVAGEIPEWTVVDMRRQGTSGVLAPTSREALAEVLRRGEQAVVLLNRRGFSGYVHCGTCGHVMTCEDCELSLTYHNESRRLLCHHCGRAYAQPSVCPRCGEAPLERGSPGTERLFDELHGLVPQGKVFRLDSDVLTSGKRARAVLADFCGTRPSVLVGTQMVAKGHDFGDVTLVVVADADTALYVPDFRAAERTFQLLTQVAGRAGRAQKPGRVIVQTWNPDAPCIKMAIDRDEVGFYRRELSIRERLGYPPFTELVRIVTAAEDVQRCQRGALHLAERLGLHFGAHELRGPARLSTLRGRNRWHILVAAEDGARARAIVRQAMAQLAEPYRRRGVALTVDVDPMLFN